MGINYHSHIYIYAHPLSWVKSSMEVLVAMSLFLSKIFDIFSSLAKNWGIVDGWITNSIKDGRYHVIYVHNMIEVILV